MAVAHLTYTTDEQRGIRRVAAGKSFRYLDADGKPVRDGSTLERIRALVIPPNWQNVWICTNPRGHLQATGRDAKGRKQYIYHPEYREARQQNKYAKMTLFGRLLPRIRARVDDDLSRRGLTRERVLATVVNLLDLAHFRVGNEEYVRANQSYGVTTMRNHHVEVRGSTLRFRFRGKSGKDHSIEVQDRRLAAIVKRCQDLPGYELFEYVDETGQIVSVDSTMVNAYLREISGEDITAKDFRTWHGTVTAFGSLCAGEGDVVSAVKKVAERLGNRPATCRKYYIHPAVIDAYTAGELTANPAISARRSGLGPDERRVLQLLEKQMRKRPRAA